MVHRIADPLALQGPATLWRSSLLLLFLGRTLAEDMGVYREGSLRPPPLFFSSNSLFLCDFLFRLLFFLLLMGFNFLNRWGGSKYVVFRPLIFGCELSA